MDEEAFECAICCEFYNATTNIPAAFPCGHSCCMKHVEVEDLKICHICREKLPKLLRPNFALRDATVAYVRAMAKFAAKAAKAEAQAAAPRAPSPPQALVPESSEVDSKKGVRQPCKFFKGRSGCRFGSKCKFAHEAPLPAPVPAPALSPTAPAAPQMPALSPVPSPVSVPPMPALAPVRSMASAPRPTAAVPVLAPALAPAPVNTRPAVSAAPVPRPVPVAAPVWTATGHGYDEGLASELNAHLEEFWSTRNGAIQAGSSSSASVTASRPVAAPAVAPAPVAGPAAAPRLLAVPGSVPVPVSAAVPVRPAAAAAPKPAPTPALKPVAAAASSSSGGLNSMSSLRDATPSLPAKAAAPIPTPAPAEFAPILTSDFGNLYACNSVEDFAAVQAAIERRYTGEVKQTPQPASTVRAASTAAPVGRSGGALVSKSWHSFQHRQIRDNIAASIQKLLITGRKPTSTEDFHEKLPLMTKHMEECLYQGANSLAEYSDQSTLKQRLQQQVRSISNKSDTQGLRQSQGSNPTPQPVVAPKPVAAPAPSSAASGSVPGFADYVMNRDAYIAKNEEHAVSAPVAVPAAAPKSRNAVTLPTAAPARTVTPAAPMEPEFQHFFAAHAPRPGQPAPPMVSVADAMKYLLEAKDEEMEDDDEGTDSDEDVAARAPVRAATRSSNQICFANRRYFLTFSDLPYLRDMDPRYYVLNGDVAVFRQHWYFIAQIVENSTVLMEHARHRIAVRDPTNKECFIAFYAEGLFDFHKLKLNHTIAIRCAEKKYFLDNTEGIRIEDFATVEVLPLSIPEVMEMDRIYSSKDGHCWACNKTHSCKCKRCAVAVYCSRECQEKDWTDHKKHCKALPEYKEILGFVRSAGHR